MFACVCGIVANRPALFPSKAVLSSRKKNRNILYFVILYLWYLKIIALCEKNVIISILYL